MLNKTVMIGRTTNIPELRYTGAGKAVATFTLAVDRDFKNGNGEKETDFIRHVVWGKLAEVVANNVGKGRLLATEGRLQVRNYEDQQGQKKQVSEIVAERVQFLDYPKDKEDLAKAAGDTFGGTAEPYDLPF